MSHKSSQSAVEITDDILNINDIFRNDIRFQLWGLFSMYPELSLSDLSKKLGKSKSTLHPHIKMLLQLDIIEIIREEKIRGSIKAKIFALKKGYDEKISSCCPEYYQKKVIDKEIGSIIARQGLAKAKIKKKTVETEIEFWEKILNSGIGGPDEFALQLLQEMYKLKQKSKGQVLMPLDSLFTQGYFSENVYKDFRTLYFEFFDKIQTIIHEDEKDDPTIEKPFFFSTQVLPLKKMFDYLHPTKLK